VAESLGMSKPQGAFVSSVEAGSPAEKAGIEAGDIILKFDGKTIEKSSDLPRTVGNTKPGTQSKLTLLRRGATREISITVGEFEPEKVAAAKPAPANKPPESAAVVQLLGLTVSDLSESQKKESKLRAGVRVDAVADPALKAGIREGDIITQIANIEVLDTKSFGQLMAKIDKTKSVSVLLRRGDWSQYTVVRPK
jgi:serine protease Do